MRGADVWKSVHVPVVAGEGWSRTECVEGLQQLERVRREVSAAEAALTSNMDANGKDLPAELARRLGVSGRVARNRARLAQVVKALPAAADLLASGQVSKDHLLALASAIAHPEIDKLLAEAPSLTPEQLRAASTRLVIDLEGDALSKRQQAQRALAFFEGPDGMVGLRGLLAPIEGALVRGVLSGIVDQTWKTEHPDRAETLGSHGSDRYDQRLADALVTLARGEGSGCGKTAVVITVSAETSDASVPGTGPVSMADVFRAVNAGADIYAAVRADANGRMQFGRSRRFASQLQRLAAIVRDQGCVYPGCDARPERCQVHHVNEFEADFGTTDIENLCLLCEPHHQHLHEQNQQVIRGPDGNWEIVSRLVLCDSS